MIIHHNREDREGSVRFSKIQNKWGFMIAATVLDESDFEKDKSEVEIA